MIAENPNMFRKVDAQDRSKACASTMFVFPHAGIGTIQATGRQANLRPRPHLRTAARTKLEVAAKRGELHLKSNFPEMGAVLVQDGVTHSLDARPITLRIERPSAKKKS